MAGPFIHQVSALNNVPVLDAVTLAATRTSAWIPCGGFNQLTTTIKFTYSAASQLSVYFEFSDFRDQVIRQNVGSTAAGTSTYFDQTHVKATSTSTTWDIAFPINCKAVRMVISGTGGTANDLVTACMVMSSPV